MVRALFAVAMLALAVDLITGVWWIGMVAAVAAWAAFVFAFRWRLARRSRPPV
jgi:hypothetical protein